jgi:hypothetical protein
MYHGKGGYTRRDVDELPVPQLDGAVRQLYDTLMDEKRAHEAALRRARSQARTRAARR